MIRHIFSVCAGMAVVCGTAGNACARGIPIVWGYGETLTEVGDLPPDVSAGVAEELGERVTVGFLYNRAHVFWLDLWTWNGRYVLHSADRYWEPDASAWQHIIGGDPSVKYGKPILYRFPLLPVLLILGVVGYQVRRRFFPPGQNRPHVLVIEKRYQRSIETMFGRGDDDLSEKAITTLDDGRFLRAKNDLIADGVDPCTAEADLRKIADAYLANTNSRIDAYLETAARLDQQGHWDRSAEIYSQLISSLPQNDERLTCARNRLTSVNDKRTANSSEQRSE